MMRPLVCVIVALAPAAFAQRAMRFPATDQRIAMIETRLKSAPKDAKLLNELSGVYLQKMRETADGAYLDRAVRLTDTILKDDPANYDARRRRVEIVLQRHEFRNVIALAPQLGRERPNDAAVFGLLGDAQMETGDYDGAESSYQKMADLRPSLASFNRIAFFRFVTGDAEGAIAAMRQGIRMGAGAAENLAWCLNDLGNMLFKTGAVHEAEHAYQSALESFPGFHPALGGLGRVFASREKFHEAIGYLERAQSVVPLPEYAGLLAKIYRRLGKSDKARQQLELLDVADKLDQAAGESTNRSLSLALADLNHRPARALELVNAELKVRRDVYTYDALAWALFRNGKAAEAVPAIEKAIAQNSPEPSFYSHAAQIFESVGRAEDARKARERVAALNPKWPQ